jgi:hypothetical protein
VAGKPATIADLFSKCSELAVQEERDMDRMMGMMVPVLAWLNTAVALRPGSLGDGFSGFTSVSLQAGPTVVTTDPEGKVAARPLAGLRTKDCLAVIREAFPELQRLVADKRRAAQVKPALSVKASIGGSHFVLDKRSYRLLVSNAGGDCRGLRISIQLPEGLTKVSRPLDVDSGDWVEVDLGVFKEVSGMERLRLHIECEDEDGRKLRWDEKVSLDGSNWQEATLGEK